MTAEALIETVALRKDYRIGGHTVHALAGIDITIRRGEFVAVMGPSGSGKSTFMNMVGCLDRPSAGRLSLAGTDAATLDEDALAALRNRLIGFVFQSFNLLPRTSALDNVALPMQYRSDGVPAAAERRRRAGEKLARVGLADRAHHHPSQLSGGQQQRVAIARALINDPLLLLADEPTGALDSRTSVEIMALFQALNAQGITVMLVTHEREVAEFSGRLLQFRDGRLVGDQQNPQPRDAAAMLADWPAAETGTEQAA
jgi:putative ABC transport system ATP-binding protein